MSYHISKPSLYLSQYVKQYWGIENCLPSGSEHVQRLVPSGLVELMFFLGDKPKALDDKRHLSDNSILSGQQKSYYDISVSGKLSLFSVSFYPYGAKMFFDMPSNEYFDQNIPLKFLVQDETSDLEDELYNAVTFEKRINVIEKFLVNQLRQRNKEYEIKRIMNSVALINQLKGVVDIDVLSSSACLCRKQYERIFAEYIGSSPKLFLRTVRFQNSLHKKQRNANIQLTELAYACGYFDQSHMIKDYKLLSGKTPTQYFFECAPYSDYFQ